MRAIDASIWRDEWFMAQITEGQLLWLGLITKVADDQGRFIFNAPLIKADLFPTNESITVQDVNCLLVIFVTDGRLHKYEHGEKTLLQIVNWWKYQNRAMWMAESKYPAPKDWTDCYRYHITPKKVHASPNWIDKVGAGFASLGSVLPNELPNALPNSLDSLDVNDEDEDEEEADRGEPASEKRSEPIPFHPKPSATAAFETGKLKGQYMTNANETKSQAVLLNAALLAAVPMNEVGRIETVRAMIAQYGENETSHALASARTAWCSTPRKNGGGTYSVINFGWVDWAQELLATGRQPWKKEPIKSDFNPFAALEASQELHGDLRNGNG